MLSGLVTFILGVIIIASWPVNSRYVLGLFLAIDLVIYGVALLGLAFQLRLAIVSSPKGDAGEMPLTKKYRCAHNLEQDGHPA